MYPNLHNAETGLPGLDSSGQIYRDDATISLDKVVNFGKRNCYNEDNVGPAKYIIDFGVNYVAGSAFRIQYKYLLKFASYVSRYVQIKCFFGWEFEDLYIDRNCYFEANGNLVSYVPPGITLTQGHKIPFTIQYMGEKIGLVGLKAMPLDRYAIVFPLANAGFAGVFKAKTQ